MTKYAKRTILDVSFNHQKVTNVLNPHLINWTYTDNLSGQIDDLNIILEDKDAVWIGNWFPSEGTIINADIVKRNWETNDFRMDLGQFEIDTIEGNDSTITIMAMATSQNTSLRGEKRSKSWEKVKLKTVISQIAKRHKMKLYWQTSDNPTKERLEQVSQSDLSFLYELCRDEGLCLKLTNNSIVVLDEQDYENNKASYTIRRRAHHDDPIKIISRRWKRTLTDVYKSCKVTHTKNKKTITGTFTPKNPPKTQRILVVKQAVSSRAEAQKLARKKLREKNKNGVVVTLTVFSLVALRAGMTFNLTDFGKLNGKYIATKVTYSGKDITIELRRCLEGY